MNQDCYIFQGYIGKKTPLIQNISSLLLFTIMTYFLMQNYFLIISVSCLLIHILIALSIWHKSKKSKILLTENNCRIVETKWFGLIKKHRQFDILSDEKDALIKFFNLLIDKESKINTFSIKSLNELTKQKVIFYNKNLDYLNNI